MINLNYQMIFINQQKEANMTILIHLIIILLVLGMLLWCIQQIPGLPAPIKTAAMIIFVLIAAVWILQHSGMVNLS